MGNIVDINASQTVNSVSFGVSTIQKVVDVNVSQTIKSVSIDVTPNLNIINVNKVQGGLSSVTSVNGQTGNVILSIPTITGTPNYIPKFTGVNSLGDGLLYDDGNSILLGTTTNDGLNKLQVNGGVKISDFSTLSGTTRSALTISPTITVTGSGSSSYLSQIIGSLTNSGTIGASTETLWGSTISNTISGLTISAKIITYGNYNLVRRNSPLDISTSTSNYMNSGLFGVQHLATVTSPIVTGTAVAIFANINNQSGTMTTAYGINNILNLGTNPINPISSIGTYYGQYISGTIGATSGLGATLTNYYAIYAGGLTVNTTGTIINRWGVYIGDSLMVNHFAGNTLIGTNVNNGTDRLQVSGSAISNAWKTTGGTVSQYVTGTGSLVTFPTIPSISGLATVTYVDQQDLLKVDKVDGERLINASEIDNLGNQSGINTGDQDLSGLATISYVDTQDSSKENYLSIPTADGYILSSTIAGVRTWIVPPTGGGTGGGDMLKATYDSDNSGVVDNAESISVIGRNATGATLYKGTIIYISGSTGNRPNFVKALASGESTSAGTFGVIQNDILNNADGYCTTLGVLDNLDTRDVALNPFTTDTLVDGDTIYLSPTIAGYITRVKPSAPNHLVYIGKVTRTSPTNGTIVYRIQNGYELDELHDVAIASKLNNEGLFYETATNLWKNKSIATVLGYTPADDSLVAHLAGTEIFTGLKSFKGTTATDTATLGAELTTTATGTNWAGTNFATGYTHTAGSIIALTATLAASINTFYLVTYTISGRTLGSIGITFGGITASAVTASGNVATSATTTAVLTITPTTDFDGTLVLSIKTISASTAITKFLSSTSAIVNEIRASNTASNFFQGINAGGKNITGNSNTFAGNSTGINNTKGIGNSYFGYNVGNGYSQSSYNAFLGYNIFTASASQAGVNSYNVAVGGNIGGTTSNTNSGGNVFLGYFLGNALTSGSSNMGMGYQSLNAVTSGSFNIAFGGAKGSGDATLNYNTTGSSNIALGCTAGSFISGGVTQATILNQSILIGVDTRPLADNQTNQIIIGHATTGLGSNTITLGNASIVQTYLSGRVTIGTTVDDGVNKLQVTGGAKITETVLAGSGALAGSALTINQTWNTTGTPTAFSVNVTNTASNGESALIQAFSNGSSRFRVRQDGNIYATGLQLVANVLTISSYINATGYNGAYIKTGSNNQTLGIQVQSFSSVSTATSFQPTSTHTIGSFSAISINPIYNQVGSTASNTDILLNRTTTSVGSGTQLLMDLQHNSVSQFSVTPSGKVSINSSAKVGDDSDVASSTNVGAIRYRADANNSYMDMVMQTGVSTYTWVNIVTNTF